ncbi:MAG: transposase [Pseudobacter sp.]|uniref:transposase n=1 Tax=Pseudobacter sp. TaxID=2045420 RepID=UPI003F7F7063
MNILEINKQFPSEEACVIYLKDLRLQKGILCKNCNQQTKHWWLDKVEKFQCSQCDPRTNLKSGTMMYKSKVPLHTYAYG